VDAHVIFAGERLELLRFGKSEDALVLERLQKLAVNFPYFAAIDCSKMLC